MMAVTGLLIILLLALSTPALAVRREFHYVNLSKNWTEAQAYCRENFYDLVTMETADDWARVQQLIVASGETWYVWVGLYDDLMEWRWSLDNSYLYEGGNTDLESWFVFDINNINSVEHCVSMNQSALSDLDCTTPLNSVCYDEASGSYIAVTVAMSWQAAQSYCRQTYTDLASVRTQAESDAIRAVIDIGSEWWVGLFRDGWKWADKGAYSFSHWYPGEPVGYPERCGTVNADYWYDATCNWKRAFICSAPVKKVLRVTLKTDGTVNLNDPLVQEAILRQMEKDLKGQGIDQDFSLRWRKQPNQNVFNKTEW